VHRCLTIRPGILPARCPLPGPFAAATAVQPAAPGQWLASIHLGLDIVDLRLHPDDAAFNARLPVAWTPTVELTAHIRASPAPGWLRCPGTKEPSVGPSAEPPEADLD
jgi:hypothetical protein